MLCLYINWTMERREKRGRTQIYLERTRRSTWFGEAVRMLNKGIFKTRPNAHNIRFFPRSNPKPREGKNLEPFYVQWLLTYWIPKRPILSIFPCSSNMNSFFSRQWMFGRVMSREDELGHPKVQKQAGGVVDKKYDGRSWANAYGNRAVKANGAPGKPKDGGGKCIEGGKIYWAPMLC